MKQQSRMAELSLTFSETAFLLWETQSPNYEFAEYLNRLYHLTLRRQNDLQLSDGTTCPFFLYYDELAALLYVLIDNPRSGIFADFANYDKIMLFNGRDAFDRQQEVFNDYATHPFPPADNDLLQWQHYELIQEARQNVFSIHYFDYRESAEVQQQSLEEMTIVRRDTEPVAKPNLSPRRRAATPVPQSSLLTAVRNANSPKMRKALNNIYLLFEDILHALENPIYDNAAENK